jgi:hypothetical protein
MLEKVANIHVDGPAVSDQAGQCPDGVFHQVLLEIHMGDVKEQGNNPQEVVGVPS